MKVVIDIPDDKLKLIKKHGLDDNFILCDVATKAIKNGKPLSRCHDEVKEELERQRRWLFKAGYNAHNIDIAFDTIKSLLKEVEE